MHMNFNKSFTEMLRHEGGYVNNRHDPGGATNAGVTQDVYDEWRADKGREKQSVRLIEKGEIEAIYRDYYWNPVHGDDLPAGVDYCLFDFAFNSSCNRAIRFLQKALGVADDGRLGQQTLAATRAASPCQLIDKICDMRLQFLQSLKSWQYFGRGWAVRVTDVRTTAKAMAS